MALILIDAGLGETGILALNVGSPLFEYCWHQDQAPWKDVQEELTSSSADLKSFVVPALTITLVAGVGLIGYVAVFFPR